MTIIHHDEVQLTMMAHAIGVPEHLVGGLVRYLVHRIPTGSGLRAVLEGDPLAGLRLDVRSAAGVPAVRSFLEAHAPPEAWGSREAVAAWLAGRKP